MLRSTATQAAIEEASAALKDEAAVLPRERMANSHLQCNGNVTGM